MIENTPVATNIPDEFDELIRSTYNYPPSNAYVLWYMNDYGYSDDAERALLDAWLLNEGVTTERVLLEIA